MNNTQIKLAAIASATTLDELNAIEYRGNAIRTVVNAKRDELYAAGSRPAYNGNGYGFDDLRDKGARAEYKEKCDEDDFVEYCNS